MSLALEVQSQALICKKGMTTQIHLAFTFVVEESA